MIGPSGNVRVYLACGVTDMRRGIDGLSALVETAIKEAPGSGAIFGLRGKRADPDQTSLVGRPRVLPVLQRSAFRLHLFPRQSMFLAQFAFVGAQQRDLQVGSIGCIASAAGPPQAFRIGCSARCRHVWR